MNQEGSEKEREADEPVEEEEEMQQQAPGTEEPDIGSYLSRAWELVAEEPLLLIAAFLLVLVLTALSGLTVVGPFIVTGPLMFGYLEIIRKRMDGEPAEIGDVFNGFSRFAESLVTFLLVAGIGLGVGLVQTGAAILLRFIPCIGTILGFALPAAVQVVLGAALFFVFPIAAFSERRPVDAVKDSIQFCLDYAGPMLLLSLVTQVLAAIGTVACGVGYLLTAPLALVMMVVAYDRYYVPNAPEAV